MRIGIIGRVDKSFADGQTISTRELVSGFKSFNIDVNVADLSFYKRNPLKAVWSVFQCVRSSDCVITMLSTNGLSVVLPTLSFFNSFYKKKLFLRAVGSGLDSLASRNAKVARCLHDMSTIWVQPDYVKEGLLSKGYTNVRQIDNFRTYFNYNGNLIVSGLTSKYSQDKDSFNLCTFSRVSEEKGIGSAINAVKKVRDNYGIDVHLDIYGQIEPGYNEQFEDKLKQNCCFVNYRGVTSQSMIIDTLSRYDALLFPTVFSGEGFPGTIIDSFASGVPVIATQWNCNSKIIKDGQTGYIYNPGDDNLASAISSALSDTSILLKMSVECLQEYKKYTPEMVIPIMISDMKYSLSAKTGE